MTDLHAMTACAMGCDPPEAGQGESFYIVVYPEMTVYGHTVDAWLAQRYPEDVPLVSAARARDMEHGCWHSVLCPAGELADHDLQPLRRVTAEQFFEARGLGWPQDPIDDGGLTTVAPVFGIATFGADGKMETWWDSQFGDDSPHDPRNHEDEGGSP